MFILKKKHDQLKEELAYYMNYSDRLSESIEILDKNTYELINSYNESLKIANEENKRLNAALNKFSYIDKTITKMYGKGLRAKNKRIRKKYIKKVGTNKRTCSICNKEIEVGYIVQGMHIDEYFCDDPCLYSKYTEKEYDKLYDEDEAFWTYFD